MAENAVRFGANKIIATLRHRQFVGLADLNQAIAEETKALNAKPFQKRQPPPPPRRKKGWFG